MLVNLEDRTMSFVLGSFIADSFGDVISSDTIAPVAAFSCNDMGGDHSIIFNFSFSLH